MTVATAADEGLRAALAALEQSWRESATPVRAILIDLDNLGVKRAVLPQTLQQILAEAAPFEVALAAGHPVGAAHARELCVGLGIDVLDTAAGPDAADIALLSAAQRLYCAGRATTFLVASHDKAFARLPGRYTLLLTGRGQPAQALLESAHTVRRVG